MDEREIRLRCIEAAAKNPTPHTAGYAAGVVASAREFVLFVLGENAPAKAPLGLPKK
jgi:hypothetical protein